MAEPKNAAELRAHVLSLSKAPPTKPEAVPAAFPEGVWAGSFAELEALDLPEPATIGKIGNVPLAAAETLLIYGPSNVGKSFLALRLVIEVALAGQSVLIVEGEGSLRALRDRIRRIGKGLRPDGIGEAASRIAITHGDFGLAEHLEQWRATLDRTKPTLVMLDPMVSYFRGDENAAGEMQNFLAHVAIARTKGAAVIVVHHSTKPDAEGKSRERGSGALRAWCDEAIGLTKGSQPGEVLIAHDKSRERGMQGVQRATWTFTDEHIICDFAEADPSAAKKAQEHKRERDLLGNLELAGGVMSLSDARKKLGSLSGSAMQELVSGLESRGLVHRANGEFVDTLGRTRSGDVLRKGPGPAAGMYRDDDARPATFVPEAD